MLAGLRARAEEASLWPIQLALGGWAGLGPLKHAGEGGEEMAILGPCASPSVPVACHLWVLRHRTAGWLHQLNAALPEKWRQTLRATRGFGRPAINSMLPSLGFFYALVASQS